MKTPNDYTHCEWCGRKMNKYWNGKNYARRVETTLGTLVVCPDCHIQYLKKDHLPITLKNRGV